MKAEKGKTGIVLFFALCFAALGNTNLPTLVMLPAYSLTTTAAGLGAGVTWTGAALPTVTIYYGTNSAGTNAANWAYSQALGATNGTAAFTASNLPTFAIHYARASASNSAGIGWSANTIFFYTLKGTPNKTVMVDTNAEVAYPTNFWSANFRFIETPVQDEAETTVDTIVPDYLADFYTQPASDIRYLGVGKDIRASDVSVDNLGYSNLVGYTAQGIFNYLDSHFFNGTNSGGGTNIWSTSNIYGVVTADHVVVEFTPENYTPAASNAESHLIAIDSRIGYLIAYCDSLSRAITNWATNTPPASNTLDSVAISGNASVNERTTENYTLTATYSDSSTEDVSTSTGVVWSLLGYSSTNISMTNRTLVAGAVGSNTQVTAKGLYTKNGVSKQNTKLVTIVNTDAPPILIGLYIGGQTSVNERSTVQLSAWAQYSDLTSNEVTSASTWSFVSAPPDYTFAAAGYFYAYPVDFTTNIRPKAIYITKSATGTVQIVNTDSNMVIVRIVGNVSGILQLWAYTNMAVYKSPYFTQKYQYTAYEANTCYVPSPGYNTNTWWIAAIDADSDGVINGGMAPPIDQTWRNTQRNLAVMINADRYGSVGTNSVTIPGSGGVVDLIVTNSACFGWQGADIPNYSDYIINVYYETIDNPAGIWFDSTYPGVPPARNRNFVCFEDFALYYDNSQHYPAWVFLYADPSRHAGISIEDTITRNTLKCGMRHLFSPF